MSDHSSLCQFRARCHAAAVEKDDISLIRGLSLGEVEHRRERGVFTVTQQRCSFAAIVEQAVAEPNLGRGALRAFFT